MTLKMACQIISKYTLRGKRNEQENLCSFVYSVPLEALHTKSRTTQTSILVWVLMQSH